MEHSAQQAQAQFDSIKEMIENLKNTDYSDEARQAIDEDPLEISVRSDWHTPGSVEDKPSEYKILLCTGGPAVRIIGELNEYQEPDNARLQHQDWGTPWTDFFPEDDNAEDILLEYARCFYFGS